MPVHPTGAYQDGTLANAIAYYWEKKGLIPRCGLSIALTRTLPA